MRARPWPSPRLVGPRTITLAAADVEEVRAALERYNTARAALDAKAEAGHADLRARLGDRRRSR